MGVAVSFLAKAIGSAVIAGYTTRLALRQAAAASSSLSFSPWQTTGATAVASIAGLVYYLKVFIQDYYVDWSYREKATSKKDLTGRTAIVTGGTVGGLGFAGAKILYERGADVIMTVRSNEKGEAAVAELQRSSSPSSALSSSPPRASFVLCDFLSESSIRNCVKEIKAKTTAGEGSGTIDFLVLNAGISNGHSKDPGVSSAEVWMTNHLGPWLFAKVLMPIIVRTAKQRSRETSPPERPRVVWVSSGAHKKASIDWTDPFRPSRSGDGPGASMKAYGQSKLANIMHAREYQKRIRTELGRSDFAAGTDGGPDVLCISLTPGAVWTNIFPPPKVLYPIFWAIMRTPEMGAQVIKMACLEDELLKGGEYLSNCYVKQTEGKDGCSNDEKHWKQLWELSAKQIEEKQYDNIFAAAADDTTTQQSNDETKKED